MYGKSQQVFELAAAVYRLAKLCPEGGVLIIKIKEKVLDILADFIRQDFCDTITKIDVLQGFFKLARRQNWVKSANFDVLDKGYQELKAFVQPPIIQKKAPKPSISEGSPPPTGEKKAILNERQEQILKFLATKKEFQLKEIKKRFPKVSDKTLRNDLKALINQKFLRREGQGAGSIYKVISRSAGYYGKNLA